MNNTTTAFEVIESFESGFADKHVIPESLEMIWFKKAIGRYSVELEPLHYDDELASFNKKLDRYIIDTLAQFMLEMYQERQVSLVNKRVSIVGKDLSIDGSGNSKKYASEELSYISEKARGMVESQKPSALI